MKKIGRFCKAYPVAALCEFKGWNASIGKEYGANVGEGELVPEAATDFLYVHEDYKVTEGIFPEERVVLANPTTEWIEFCRDKLKFAIPSAE